MSRVFLKTNHLDRWQRDYFGRAFIVQS